MRILLMGGQDITDAIGSRLALEADDAERLRAALQLPVERARTLASVRVGRLGLDAGELAELEPLSAVPIGLALGAVA